MKTHTAIAAAILSLCLCLGLGTPTTTLAAEKPATEGKNPSIMGVQLGDTPDKLLANPEIQKLKEVDTAFATSSFLSPWGKKPQSAMESYLEETKKIQEDKAVELDMLHHPSAEKFWKMEARFKDEATAPKLLGLTASRFEAITRYHPESQSFRIHECSIRLINPSDADPKQTMLAVTAAISKQYGEPKTDNNVEHKHWEKIGGNQTDISILNYGDSIGIKLFSTTMNAQTTASHKKRLAELQKPAPVTGTLE